MSRRRKIHRRTPEQRQARALKEAAAREVQNERDRQDRIERDRRAEIENEKLAPAVMRQAIVTPDGHVITGPRVQVVDGRAVRASDTGHAYSHRQLRAAARIREDWAAVGQGCNVSAADPARTGGGGDGTGGHAAMLAQIAIRQSLEGAFAYLGAFVPIVQRVILDHIPLSAWPREWNARRERAGLPPASLTDAVILLGQALTRLADYYTPKRDASRPPAVLAFGPARESYVMTVDAIQEMCHAAG